MMAQEDESRVERGEGKSIKYNFVNKRDNNRFASLWQSFKWRGWEKGKSERKFNKNIIIFLELLSFPFSFRFFFRRSLPSCGSDCRVLTEHKALRCFRFHLIVILCSFSRTPFCHRQTTRDSSCRYAWKICSLFPSLITFKRIPSVGSHFNCHARREGSSREKQRAGRRNLHRSAFKSGATFDTQTLRYIPGANEISREIN